MRLWNHDPAILQLTWISHKIPPRRARATFIVKATFKLTPGGVCRPIQERPVDQRLGPVTPEEMPDLPHGDVPAGPPVPLGEVPGEALARASDFAPYKPRADLLLNARAHAPGGAPVALLAVGFQVGDWRKELLVTGDRREIDGRAGEITPFTVMPLGWERAYGGPGYAPNPIGKGATFSVDERGRRIRALPNLLHPADARRAGEEELAPAGFAAIPPSWPGRGQGAMGTFDASWLARRWPWYPADIDWGVFNAAPFDQRIEGYLSGGEALRFDNLHPERPRLETRLPGLRARCFLLEDTGETILVEESEAAAPFPPEEDEEEENPPREPPPTIEIPELGLSHTPIDVLAKMAQARRSARVPTLKPAPKPAKKVWKPVLRWREVPLVLDTLTADLETGRINLVWRGVAEVASSRLREIEEVFVLAEPLDTPDHGPDHYRALLEAQRADWNAQFERGAPFSGEALAAGIEARMIPLKAGIAAGKAAVEEEMARMAGFTDQALAALARRFPKTAAAVAEVAAARLAGARGGPEAGTQALASAVAALKARLATTAGAPVPPSVIGLLDQLAGGGGIEDLPEAAAARARADEVRAEMDAVKARLAEAFGESDPETLFASRAEVEAALESGASLRGARLWNLDLSGLDLSGRDLTNASVRKTSLKGALLRGAELARASFNGADLDGADLRTANFAGAIVKDTTLVGACLAGAAIDNATFSGGDLTRADFTGVHGRSPLFHKAVLTGARFVGAHLVSPQFHGARLEGADFTGAEIDRCDFMAAKAAGIILENAILTGLRAGMLADFSGARARGLQAPRANLERARLDGADFRGARLDGAMLNEVVATGARFDGASLIMASFSEADLRRAVLAGANLRAASFERADLQETDLSGSNLYGALVRDTHMEATAVGGAFIRHSPLEAMIGDTSPS